MLQTLRALCAPALIVFALEASPVASATPAPDATRARACGKLTGTTVAAARILRAALVSPPFSATWDGNSVKEKVTVPFCLIEARAASSAGSDIRFEVWLPTANWNARLLGIGAGGSLGAINRPDLGLGVNRGFAAVATDNGHRGYRWNDSAWALGHPERIEDFGYRAHHLATQAAKALVKRFYGRREAYAYYFGCSQGGTKGLMAAQRYPQDYNGILAGAPVYSWPAEMTFQAWNYRALTATPGAAISPAQMLALYAAAAKQCGGADGLIGDPRQCRLDPAVLQCPAGGAECLSPLQVEAVRKMYQGPRDSSGTTLNRGLTPGSESRWEGLWTLVQPDPTRSGSWLGVYRYMVFADPQWDPATLNFDADPQNARRKLGPILDPDDPDLSRFRERGGKLIVYHGWGDQMVPAETSTDYHAAVAARLGDQSVDEFFRLFMLPGVGHCSGGPGAGEILHTSQTDEVPLEPERDLLLALQRWVEHGEAPAHLVATKADDDGHVLRTRLVCPEPQASHYSGSGDPLDAASWECVAPPGKR